MRIECRFGTGNADDGPVDHRGDCGYSIPLADCVDRVLDQKHASEPAGKTVAGDGAHV